MRVVFDTNVLVAAFTASGLCHQVYERVLVEHTLVTAEVLIEELRRTLRDKFKLSPTEVASVAAAVAADAEVVAPTTLPQQVCRDSDDDWVLATAVAGQAAFIVTGDDDLLTLTKYEGVRILSPRGFLEVLACNP